MVLFSNVVAKSIINLAINCGAELRFLTSNVPENGLRFHKMMASCCFPCISI